MGIQPPSDIVLDVMQAADPRKAMTVAANLQKLSASASSGVFDSMVAGTHAGFQAGLAYASSTPVGLRNMTALSQQGAPVHTLDEAGTAAAAAKDSPYKKFEAMVLSTFVESMLPKNATAVYGSGNAGGVWRTMLAQKIGDQVAQAGGIGIAAKIAPKQTEMTAAVSGAATAAVQPAAVTAAETSGAVPAPKSSSVPDIDI